MDAPAPDPRPRGDGSRRLLDVLATADVAVCTATALLAVLVVTAGVVLGSAWPAALLVGAAATPAVVPVQRLSHVLVVVLTLGGGVAAVLAAGDSVAAPWLLVGLLAASGLGARGSVQRRRLERQLADAHSKQDATSVHDDLTGCSNHAGLLLFGDHLLQGVRRRGEAMHALVVDVDGLARVGERLGRGASDEILVAVAEALRAGTRGTDVVARGTSEGFAVLGPGAGVSAGELERRVRAHLVESPPAPLDVWPCRVTAGLAVLEPWDGGDVTDLLRKAKQDLSLRASLRAPSAPEPVRRGEPKAR